MCFRVQGLRFFLGEMCVIAGLSPEGPFGKRVLLG